ncbi:type I-U CRISPR-associated RAMP protein Csb1/Cas7u [Actinomyces trachealis]|uniref:type I-G CRISPR-associated RAMP protein Csb1/Cas7g n=1 Tax=Actinomyces trachealis TaxID=2763540 RepID=UPI0018928BFC|nr:type I-U CRISPR-associated RAMP protein Csb1/Cas7u [Actinomyces trachealis]
MGVEASFRNTIQDLVDDAAVAGISLTGQYESLIGRTVTPPAGTIRNNGEVTGIFNLEDGRKAATLDSWGACASRCESLLAGSFRGQSLADRLGFPLVTFLDEHGHVLTTSVHLSHRQADATWRLARNELIESGISYEDIHAATRAKPDALLTGFPTAIPFGWWHSHARRTLKATSDKGKNKPKSSGRLADIRDEYLASYAMAPSESRSARLFTAEFLALGVSERLRVAGKIDSLFGGVPKVVKLGGADFSDLGLGSVPPGVSDKTPSDLTYEEIESRAFFSLTGLRSLGFSDPGPARCLTVALTLLLYTLMHENLSLRAGTELKLLPPGLQASVVRHGAQDQPMELPKVESLADMVRDLGAEIGWQGPRSVTIRPDSPLGQVLLEVDGAQ